MFVPASCRSLACYACALLVFTVLGCGAGTGDFGPATETQTPPGGKAANEPVLVRMAGQTMGTSFAITIADPPSELPADWQLQVDLALRKVNDQMSTYLEDSELSRFNRDDSGDWFPVSEDLAYVVAAAQAIARKTAGAFDVTVGPLVNAWNFGPGKRSTRPPAKDEVLLLQKSVGYEFLEVREDPPALRKSNPGVYVDLSAIAKGYGVDKIVELLSSFGCQNVFVDIGGEDRVMGTRIDRAWRVAVEDPVDGVRQFEYAIELKNQAIATSGDYRNFFMFEGKRYSHTIDPTTGFPVDHNVALVSVVHDNCMEADGWATAMNVLGDERGLALANELGLAVRFVVRTPEDTTKAIATKNFPPNILPEP